LEVLLAEHARGVDEELRVAADRVAHAILDPHRQAHLHALAELRIDLAAPELDLFDLADLDPGHLHRRARLQATDVVVVDVELETRAQREVAEHEDEADEDRGRHEDEKTDFELEAAFAHDPDHNVRSSKNGDRDDVRGVARGAEMTNGSPLPW